MGEDAGLRVLPRAHPDWGGGARACADTRKFPGIRAATGLDSPSAQQSVEGSDVNVMGLGAWLMERKHSFQVPSGRAVVVPVAGCEAESGRWLRESPTPRHSIC